jgi:branched-chain amino acid transport system ATP-binding protein
VTPALVVEQLSAGYDGITVLHEVSLSVAAGDCAAVLGANGAGKTTLLRALSGVTSVTGGAVHLHGEAVTGWKPSRIVAAGLGHVPENRRVFGQQNVVENLRLGAFVRRRDRRGVADDIARMLDRFPSLSRRSGTAASALSGGEQQMLALAIALMARPTVLLLDEPSNGLAPLIVTQVFDEVRALQAAGTAVVIVEQLANEALDLASTAVVLRAGRVFAAGPAADIAAGDVLTDAYLGR